MRDENSRSTGQQAQDAGTAVPAVGTPLPSHHRHCFVCGPDNDCGLQMRLSVGADSSIDGQLTITDRHQGAPGLAHGGLLTAALDDALGTVAWLNGTAVVTANMECRFKAPVPVGAKLYIHAWRTEVKGRKIFAAAHARLNGADGPVAISATALFLSVPLDFFTTHGNATQINQAIADPDFVAEPPFGIGP